MLNFGAFVHPLSGIQLDDLAVHPSGIFYSAGILIDHPEVEQDVGVVRVDRSGDVEKASA
jgi:hypothetical protein